LARFWKAFGISRGFEPPTPPGYATGFVHELQSKGRLRLVSKYLHEEIATLAAIQLDNKLHV